MNKFIRNNQKKLLALFSAFLMVVFILPSSFKNGRGGGAGDRVEGQIGKTKVTNVDFQQAANAWQELSRYEYRDPNSDALQQVGILEYILGQNAAHQIAQSQNGEAFFLLGEEARKAGVIVRDDDVISLIKNNLYPIVDDPDQIDQLKPAVAQLLSVHELLDRAQRMVKYSQPRIDLLLAQMGQKLAVNVLLFPADDYLATVAQPTPTEIKNQYDTFSDRLPDAFGAPGDKLGFGYKYPDRVKLQYIGLHNDDVARAAKASKSELDWDQAAFSDFKDKREQYDDQEVAVAATQPASQPTISAGGGLSIQPAAPTTQMAVRKVDDVTADFELHHDLVLKQLYEQETDALAQTILKKISDTMTADYAAWSEAQSGKGPTTQPASTLGPPYNTKAYIDALAQSIQTQFKVLPVTGQVDRFEGPRELADVTDIGKTLLEPRGQSRSLTFTQYAMFVKGLANGDTPGAMSPMQLSMRVQSGNDYYLFRVTAIDPSHTAPLDEVTAQVIRDWRLNQAYLQASDAAGGAITLAQSIGLQKAAIRMGRPGITTTEKFGVESILQAGDSAKIPPLILKPISATELASAAAALLTTPPPTHDLRPMSLLELFPDAIAGVIELDQAAPAWKPGNAEIFKSLNMSMLIQNDATNLTNELCALPNIESRVNYIAAKK